MDSEPTSSILDLPVVLPKVSCTSLASATLHIDGLAVKISAAKTGRASSTQPEYCHVQGTVAKYIDIEVLLPTKTWHERYLQVGCSALCGSINLTAPESSGYTPLEEGYFVVASDNEGHSGEETASWAGNAAQRVDFAYLADHDTALVAKGLASRFYGVTPRFSYFDGCSQGGHEALTEIQRYPSDFNGVLAGAPASIMTEQDSFVREWEADVNVSASGHPIVTAMQAALVHKSVLKACADHVGLVLDFRSCGDKFKIKALACTESRTANCLSAAQIAVFEKIYAGPETPNGERLYVGGYSVGSEEGWGLPASTSETVARGGAWSKWLEYLAFARDIGTAGVDDEAFTRAYFEEVERLAPLYDATNPDLSSFKQRGGKLILWQGEEDPTVPTNASIAYYQAVVKAMGGLHAVEQFAKDYVLPGVGHCGNSGPDTFPGLSSVVTWTERGGPPDALVATEYASGATSGGLGSPLRTIELYPYPDLPAYSGHRNPDRASSYVPRYSAALTRVIPWLGRFDEKTMWCNASGTGCFLTK
jgi:feruloyl esterase